MDSLKIICPNGHLGLAPLRTESFEIGVAAGPDYIAADSGSDASTWTSGPVPTTTGGLVERLEQYEAELIRAALEQAAGDIPSVMDSLRLPRKTLYDKLRRHGLKPADYRARTG